MGNAGEVLPHPASPLGWTLVWEPGVLEGWRDSLVNVGTLTPDEIDADEVVGLFGGYLFINASTARLFGVRAPGLSAEMVDLTYFGDHPDVPPYVAAPWHESETATASLAAWMQEVLSEPLDLLLHDRTEADAARASRPSLGRATDHELVERARGFVPLVRRLFEHHLTVTGGASIGQGIVAQVAASLGDPGLALRLITGIGDVDSALPSQAMWALSRLPAGGDEFDRAFADFLRAYGSRGPNEWDIRSDTWETDPRMALDLIEVMRKQGDDGDPAGRAAAGAADREAATAAVRRALAEQPATLAQFEAGLLSAHRYMAGRERAKTNIIKVIHEIRVAIRELGSRHGYSPSQTCMLLADELDAFVNDPDEFGARLDQREREYLELWQLEPPFIVDGAVDPLPRWRRRQPTAAAPASVGTVLRGVPGCPGTATGIARVILDPADPLELEPGDILVAPHTDPAWTPLFVPAAAVVVDVGAQVSHAIIVSRELGLPCVVSVTGATGSIPNGARITVDGDAGTVTVLSPSP